MLTICCMQLYTGVSPSTASATLGTGDKQACIYAMHEASVVRAQHSHQFIFSPINSFALLFVNSFFAGVAEDFLTSDAFKL